MDQKKLIKLLMKIPKDDKIQQIRVLNSFLYFNEQIDLRDIINRELWRHNFSHVNIKDPTLNDSVVSLLSSYVYLLEESNQKMKEELIKQRNKLLNSPFSFLYKKRVKDLDKLLDVLDIYHMDNLSSVIPSIMDEK